MRNFEKEAWDEIKSHMEEGAYIPQDEVNDTHVFLYKRAKRDVEHVQLDFPRICEAVGAHIYGRQATELDCERILYLLSQLFCKKAVASNEAYGFGVGAEGEFAISRISKKSARQGKDPNDNDANIESKEELYRMRTFAGLMRKEAPEIIEGIRTLRLTERARVSRRAWEGIELCQRAKRLGTLICLVQKDDLWKRQETEQIIKGVFKTIPSPIDLFGADTALEEVFSGGDQDTIGSTEMFSFVKRTFPMALGTEKDREGKENKKFNVPEHPSLDTISILIVEESKRYNVVVAKMRAAANKCMRAFERRRPIDYECDEVCHALVRAEVPGQWQKLMPNIDARTIHEWMELFKKHITFFQEWASLRIHRIHQNKGECICVRYVAEAYRCKNSCGIMCIQAY